MNFEALGRYTDAVQRIERLKIERQHVASKMLTLFGLTEVEPAGTVRGFDMVRAQDLVQRMADKSAALMFAVQDANAVAVECQKPLIYVERSQ